MQLNENYEEFTGKFFTEYMTRSYVVDAFIRQLTLKKRTLSIIQRVKNSAQLRTLKKMSLSENTPQAHTVTD